MGSRTKWQGSLVISGALIGSLKLRGYAAGRKAQGDVDFYSTITHTTKTRYVVPTGRVIATDSVIVATTGYVVPAAYDINPGLKDLSRAETYKWYQSLVALDIGSRSVDNDEAAGCLFVTAASRNSRIHELATTLLQKKCVVWILYGSAGGHVITAAGGHVITAAGDRSYKENSRFKRKVATGFMVPAGLLMVFSACLVRYCFVIAAGL
ncbi:hypothetical protein Tco_0191208 [Tanacetum coccineum]